MPMCPQLDWSQWGSCRRDMQLTQRHIVVCFYGHILLYLGVVNCLQDSQAMPDTAHAQLFQLSMLQSYQYIPRDTLLCMSISSPPPKTAMPPTSKRVGILFQAEVGYEVCHLVVRPFGNHARGAALAVPGVGECRGRVFGAEGPGARGRVLVVGGQGGAHDAALKFVVGV